MGCKNCEQVMSDDSMFEGKISPFPLCLHKNQLVNVKSATVEQKSRSNIHTSTHMFNRVS